MIRDNILYHVDKEPLEIKKSGCIRRTSLKEVYTLTHKRFLHFAHSLPRTEYSFYKGADPRMSSPAAKIFEAAEKNDLETVKMFIENGGMSPSITRGPYSKDTLADVAAKKGNLGMLKYLAEKDSSLLKAKSDDRLGTFDRSTILETAVEDGHLDIVKYLVEVHNVNILKERHTLWGSYSAVDLAVFKGHLNIVRYFIEERHVDPNTNASPSDYFKRKPLLFKAVESEQHNITSYLIENKKVHLTVLDLENRNILFPAVLLGDIDFIKNVLDVKKAEIDINWRDNEGKTLVYLTVTNDLIDILQYLVEQKQADVNIPGDRKKEYSPLLKAVLWSKFEVFKYLVDHGADLERRDKDGSSPLHLAAGKTLERSEFCKYLLEHGANVKSKNNKGETPLQVALTAQNLETSKCLINFSGNVNEKNDDGETLLHLVAAHDQIELLDYLVNEKHAQINVTREKDHWTPLHCAAMWGHHKICEYLIKQGADPRAKDKMGRGPAQVASNETLIDLIQKAAEVRSRRSVDHFFSIPAQHSEPNSRTYRLPGGWRVNETVSANEIEAFQLHSMLAFTNFVIRYFFPSFVRTQRIEVNDDLAPNAEYLPNGVVHIAEDAVHAFLDFEEKEEEEVV